jgi:hypothetical protein
MALKPYNTEDEQKIIRDCVKAARNIKSMTDRAYAFLYSASRKRTYTIRFAIV